MNIDFTRTNTIVVGVIVISLIAIAIAITPTLSDGGRFTVNGVASAYKLKSLIATQITWSNSDADRNGIKDYWVADVSGLYRVRSTSDNSIAYIDLNFARADYSPAIDMPRLIPLAETYLSYQKEEGKLYPISSSGFYFAVFRNDEFGVQYAQDLDGDGYACENATKYAYMSFPEKAYVTGHTAFIVNESGIIYKIKADEPEDLGGRNAGRSFNLPLAKDGRGGRPSTEYPMPPITDWPAADPTTVGYTKLDW